MYGRSAWNQAKFMAIAPAGVGCMPSGSKYVAE